MTGSIGASGVCLPSGSDSIQAFDLALYITLGLYQGSGQAAGGCSPGYVAQPKLVE